MQAIEGYAEAMEMTPGEFEQLEPGGYICKITQALEERSAKSGARMLVLHIDIAEGPHADYYKRQFDSDSSAGRKWRGVYRQLMEGKSLGFFKGLMGAIENSNPGYQWNWDEKSLAGLMIGGVFGREEYYSMFKGDYAFATKCVSMRSVEAVRAGVEPPKDKLADKTQSKAPMPPMPMIGPSVDVTDDDDLPF